MTNKLLCPFCQQELQQTYDGKQFWCSNYKDQPHPMNIQGTKELWQALIDTKKKLDIAVGALEDIAESNGDFITGSSTTLDAHEYAEMMLKQINEITKGGKDGQI